MPISAVRGRARRHRPSREYKILSSSRMIELDSLSVEVDAVGDIMPHPFLKSRIPVALTVGIPLQKIAGITLRAKLHLGEVTFEEADLVFFGWGGRVRSSVLDGEVVENFALVDGRAGLWNELGAEHCLAIPGGGFVDADLDAFVRSGVCEILVVWAKSDVVASGAASVDVVLVWTDLVGPGPVVEERSRFVVVQAAIPEKRAC